MKKEWVRAITRNYQWSLRMSAAEASSESYTSFHIWICCCKIRSQAWMTPDTPSVNSDCGKTLPVLCLYDGNDFEKTGLDDFTFLILELFWMYVIVPAAVCIWCLLSLPWCLFRCHHFYLPATNLFQMTWLREGCDKNRYNLMHILLILPHFFSLHEATTFIFEHLVLLEQHFKNETLHVQDKSETEEWHWLCTRT